MNFENRPLKSLQGKTVPRVATSGYRLATRTSSPLASRIASSSSAGYSWRISDNPGISGAFLQKVLYEAHALQADVFHPRVVSRSLFAPEKQRRKARAVTRGIAWLANSEESLRKFCASSEKVRSTMATLMVLSTFRELSDSSFFGSYPIIR